MNPVDLANGCVAGRDALVHFCEIMAVAAVLIAWVLSRGYDRG